MAGIGRRLAALAAVMEAAGIGAEEILDRDNIKARIKLQKIVFMLAEAGLVPALGSYEFNLYVHGPYSPGLADDYYRLARAGDEAVAAAAREAELGEEAARLVRRLAVEPVEVLELAATLLDIVRSHAEAGLLSGSDREGLLRGRLPRPVLSHLWAVKPWASRGEVERAYRVLLETGLLQRLLARVEEG